MSEEIKHSTSVRSFRVSDEVMNRFKEIQGEANLTQDSALRTLIDAYELENAKNTIPERETEIANFQAKASELIEAFLYSLQLNQDAEVRVRAEFSEQLQTKDRVIAVLQQRLDTVTEDRETVYRAHEQLKETAASASEAIHNAGTEIQKLRETLKDKQTIIHTLETENAKFETLSANYEALEKSIAAEKERTNELRQKNVELEAKLRASEAEHQAALKEAETNLKNVTKDFERALKESEKNLENALKAAENEKKQVVLDAREDARKSIDVYVDKYEAKLIEMENLHDELLRYKAKYAELEKRAKKKTV